MSDSSNLVFWTLQTATVSPYHTNPCHDTHADKHPTRQHTQHIWRSHHRQQNMTNATCHMSHGRTCDTSRGAVEFLALVGLHHTSHETKVLPPVCTATVNPSLKSDCGTRGRETQMATYHVKVRQAEPHAASNEQQPCTHHIRIAATAQTDTMPLTAADGFWCCCGGGCCSKHNTSIVRALRLQRP